MLSAGSTGQPAMGVGPAAWTADGAAMTARLMTARAVAASVRDRCMRRPPCKSGAAVAPRGDGGKRGAINSTVRHTRGEALHGGDLDGVCQIVAGANRPAQC